MYGFVGHWSACEGLRSLRDGTPQWPAKARKLPNSNDCVSTQRDFKRLRQTVDLAAYGIVSTPVDLLVSDAAARSRGKGATFHVWKHDIPTRSMFRVDDSLLISGPELTIIELAGYQLKLAPLLAPFVAGLNAEREVIAAAGSNDNPIFDDPLAWEGILRTMALVRVIMEFAGSYRLGAGDRDLSFGATPLTSRARVHAMLYALPGKYGTTRVQRALDLAFDGSASPMETSLALMLTLPLDFGGFGLPRPLLNVPLDVANRFSVPDGRNVIIPDLLWPNEQVCLEYDSDTFHARNSRIRAASDAQRANILTALGYTTLRATTATVANLGSMSRLATQLAAALGTQLTEPSLVQALRRTKLFSFLMRQG